MSYRGVGFRLVNGYYKAELGRMELEHRSLITLCLLIDEILDN
jgi:hypothetical protein